MSGEPLEALLNNSKWDGLQIVENDPPPHTIQERTDFFKTGDYSIPTYYSERPLEGTMGIWDISISRAPSGRSAVIWVSMKPGATAFTRTPLGASSLAADFVSPIRPAFAAVHFP